MGSDPSMHTMILVALISVVLIGLIAHIDAEVRISKHFNTPINWGRVLKAVCTPYTYIPSRFLIYIKNDPSHNIGLGYTASRMDVLNNVLFLAREESIDIIPVIYDGIYYLYAKDPNTYEEIYSRMLRLKYVEPWHLTVVDEKDALQALRLGLTLPYEIEVSTTEGVPHA